MVNTRGAKRRLFCLSRFCVLPAALFALLFVGSFLTPRAANACCWACAESDCDSATQFIEDQHESIKNRVEAEFDEDLAQFEDWMEDVMFDTQFAPAMKIMTTQMSAVAMQYTEIIGSFLDAQIQMDTQRLYRELQFQAHKDYRPSDDFCWFGTNVRSLAATESRARFNALALSQISLARQLGNINMAGARTPDNDYKARWTQFVDTYCDPGDNNGLNVGSGLRLACDHDGVGGNTDAGAEDRRRVNRDIDYTRLIDEPRTLDLTFVDNGFSSSKTLDTVIPVVAAGVAVTGEPGDEEDVIALSRNLYGHKVLSRGLSRVMMKSDTARKLYLALRSVAAKRGVAQASFNAIVGLKASGTDLDDPLDIIIHPSGTTSPAPLAISARGLKATSRYLAAIVNQLLPADPTVTAVNIFSGGNIFDMIGHSPSYYSQLEILAKRIYQNPSFYANLYDTPENVSRKKVAMRAIELMVDRAIYESQLRREMSVSVLLASKLRESHRKANMGLATTMGK